MSYSEYAVDLYSRDVAGKPDVEAFVRAGPPWCGLIMKASEGGREYDADWFRTLWSHVRATAGDRWGVNFFTGAYHYWLAGVDDDTQADEFLRVVEQSGGWDGGGNLWPMVDVESGENPPNARHRIIDGVSRFSERVAARTGLRPTLYAGSYLYDNAITDHLGCGRLHIARYTRDRWVFGDGKRMLAEERIGWADSELLAWQGCGDGEAAWLEHPRQAPIGPGGKLAGVDISVITYPGGLAAVRRELSQ